MRQKLRYFIIDSLAKHPDLLLDALEAIAEGMQEALRRSNEARAKYDLAFRSALSLASPGRVTAETRKVLNDAIVRAIEPEGMSKVEREALERLANLVKDETAI